MHGRSGLMRNVVYEEALLWGCMHLLNGSARSYVHDVQLFKIECFFEINMIWTSQCPKVTGNLPSSIRPSIHLRQRGERHRPFLNCKTPLFQGILQNRTGSNQEFIVRQNRIMKIKQTCVEPAKILWWRKRLFKSL
jgi:hypothetical protein